MLLETPLYAICDADLCARSGWTLVDFAHACLDGGARLLQIRAKGAGSGAFLADVSAIAELADPFDATIIVNDRVDIARLGAAAGVHVGQDDLTAAAIRTIAPVPFVIGLSTHSEEQASAALNEPIDYLAIGPIFGTNTKHTGYEPRGLDVVRAVAAAATAHHVPVVGIGGISLARAPAVIAAGAQSVAVISDLLVSGDPSARVREFLRVLA
jgi:thiamine-phosphate pyrophosphorylase